MAKSKAILWIVLTAQFMIILDVTVVTVALPSISTDLDFGSQLDLQWVIDAYSLVFGGFLLFGGRAGDFLGRRRLFLIGLTLFALASLVSGLAQNPGTLIVGRAVQALGGALTSPAVLAIIIVTFEGVAERAKALGTFSAVTASGGAVGILASGVLTEWLSWRAIFLVNVPFAVVAIVGALRVVPNSSHRVEGPTTIDLPGAVTITAGLLLLVYGIVKAQSAGWSSAAVLTTLLGAAVLVGLFVAIQAKSKQPLIRLGVFKVRALSVANLSMFLMRAGLLVTLFFPTLYLAQVKHYDPIEVGVAYLPWPVAMFLAGRVAQKIIANRGPKLVLWPGLIINAVGLFAMTFLGADSSYAGGVLPGMILTALGTGFAWAALFLVASVGVKPEESGLASGIINTSQQLGGAIGLAVMSSVAAAYTRNLVADGAGLTEATVKGFDRAFTIAALVVVAAAVVAVIGLRSSDGRPEPTVAKQNSDEAPVVTNLEGALGD